MKKIYTIAFNVLLSGLIKNSLIQCSMNNDAMNKPFPLLTAISLQKALRLPNIEAKLDLILPSIATRQDISTDERLLIISNQIKSCAFCPNCTSSEQAVIDKYSCSAQRQIDSIRNSLASNTSSSPCIANLIVNLDKLQCCKQSYNAKSKDLDQIS